MARLNSLNSYVFFEAVARRKSVTRAAEELLVSPSAVSQQVKLLEQQLGIKLFRREGRSSSLTLEGEQLFKASSAAIRMLKDAQRHLGKQHEARRLNLRVTPSFGVRWLGPRLADFVQSQPTWDLRVDAAPDPTDFDREIMDFDIRYGTAAWEGFECQPILSDQVLPLCAPAMRDDLRARFGTDPAAMLGGARLIDSARALCQWDFWLHRNGLSVESNTKSILLDRSSLALQMACDGAGVVLESLAVATGEVARGDLVPLTPTLPVVEFPAYWVVCPARHMKRRAVASFLTWISEQADLHKITTSSIMEQYDLSVDVLQSPADELGGQGAGTT
ncbi:LysR substrate-binding domain-containing protein [Pacificibacter marinus]|uniref:Glycine cleavage system transcriptional activator n=1 Tax=Pacificibacter marinus TaxID=658057 RepID=A0A1Y5TRU9_9RHOB|nr:LysR substrate-binding domain-containing protein [Pacificibacter marinus]SEL33282.1 LysR family transcriptional regulator, glycine cleavage system transcriptional activator [Pacificibacter marinus]SLN68634.1 Glycine cleavage system transcriptional activator [Pacificibacter marinus]